MEVPRKFWGEALRSVAYLLNRTPSKVLDFKTPLQKLRDLTGIQISDGLKPRIFGCTTYVHQNVGNLEPRSVRCMFLGYADAKKGYICFDLIQNKVHVMRDVAFHETIPYFGHECSLQGEKNEEVKTHDFHELSMFFDEEEGECGNYEIQIDVDTPSTNSEPEPSTNGNHENHELESEQPNTTNTPDVTNIPDVNSGNSDVVLQDMNEEGSERRYPVAINRGQPKRQYVPDLKAKAKYPIGNFVSHYMLSDTHALRVEKMSSVTIPRDV